MTAHSEAALSGGLPLIDAAVFPYRRGNRRFIRVSGFRDRVEETNLTLSLRIHPGGARLNFWIATPLRASVNAGLEEVVFGHELAAKRGRTK